MRRRRSPTILLIATVLLVPVLVYSQTYDAVPIGRPFFRPPPSPRQEPEPQIARGYQPPPRPSHFQPPRSYQQQPPNFQQPSLNLNNRPRPQFNWQMQQLQQQHPQRFQPPTQHMIRPQAPQRLPPPPPPRDHMRSGSPGQIPQFHNSPHIRIPTSSTLRKQTQVEVAPADIRNGGQLDPVNNIIIHLYLNSKDRMSHAEIKTPVHGLFGIGTSHGGPGSHSDPIVITKDFDRDTLEFVDEGQAAQLNGPSNIIEVKATVSTPNRQLENTVNHAVNMELNKAIPKVMDRMRGSTMTMDNGMRKELEEALVDELAKNLGETIDNTDVTEEDLSKLIEEGFDEVTRGETTTRPPVVTVVVTRPTTSTTTTTTPRPTTTTTRPTTRSTTTSTTTTTTHRPTTQRTTTQRPTTTEWTNLVTDQSNDDDYFTEGESEDISVTTIPPPTTSTTRRTVVITSPSTTTTRVWTTPTTTTTTTERPTTRSTSGHVHVMPGIRVTERPTTTTTTTERPTTTTTTTTTTTPRPTTTTNTVPPYRPPTSVVTFSPEDASEEQQHNVGTVKSSNSEFNLPTRKPMVEVSPSMVPHHGVVNLESNEDEDYTKTVTSQPVSMYTQRTTAIQNLPTKPAAAATLHPSTFSPPLVTEEPPSTFTDEPGTSYTQPQMTEKFTTSESFTHSTSESIPTPSTTEIQPEPTQTELIFTTSTTSSSTTTRAQPQSTESSNPEETTASPTSEPFNVPSEPFTVPPTPSDPSTNKIEVVPHTKYTEEPFFSTSSIEWNPTTSAEEVSTSTQKVPPPMIMDEDYDYTNEFALPPSTTTTTTSTNLAHSTRRPSVSSSEEIQPNFVLQNGPCPTPNNPYDRNRTDVLFLLDSSDDFNEQKFQRALQLIGDTVGKFSNFGPDGTQVSLVQYNDEPYLEFSLRKHNCKKHLLDDIADTEYMAGGSQLDKALEKVSQFAFTKKRGDRPDAENVLIIVTDGPSSDRVQQPTRLALQNNVTVLVISTLGADKQFVKELAGHQENNLFGLEDQDKDLSWKLARRIGESSGSSRRPSAPIGTLTPVHPDNDLVNDNGSSAPVTATVLPTHRPISETENEGIVHLECVGDGFKIKINPPAGFRGVAVVKGYQDDARCKATATSSGEANLFISNEECGVTQVKSFEPKGLNSSLVIHLLHDKDLHTYADRAYLLQCFIGTPEDAELSTNLDVVKSELAIAETISLATLPPTCTYSIRKDGPDGSIVTKAVVGQTVYHRWDCDGSNETSNAYGIQVHSCYASDDVERKFAFVDPRGCSSDLTLLSDLQYADDSLTAWAASHVFSVHNADSLKFVCKLSLCTRDGDGCEGVTPPSCGNQNKTGLLLTKRLAKGQNSVDEALTSALTTKVGLSTRSVDSLEDVLQTVASSYLFWIVALVAVAGIVAISIISRNLAENSDTATTCSEPTSSSMSASQDFGSIRSIHSEVPPTNERLADFMRTFDRNRYV